MAKPKTRKSPKAKVDKEFIATQLADLQKLADEAGLKVFSAVTDKTAGAPTLYEPKYCHELIEHMSSGLSIEAFAGKIGVCEKTIYNWRETYPEFLQAHRIGKAKSRLFWEQLGNSGAAGHLPGFNASSYKYNMANRFQWTDRQDVTSGGKKLPEGTQPKVIINLPANGREGKE